MSIQFYDAQGNYKDITPMELPADVEAGDIFYWDGSALVRLAKGAASQTLKMNAGATAPEWVTVG